VTRATTVVGLALGLATVGCGSDTIDAAEVEAGIERSLSSATASVSSVSCPSDVEKEEGATFTCDAKLKVEARRVACTATGSGGRQSQLTFTFSSADGTIDESSVSGSGA
jgi:hypothetical protein